MRPRYLEVSTIGKLADKILILRKKGWIHSVFENAINLLVGPSELICLTMLNLLNPWTVIIEDHVDLKTLGLKENMKIHYHPNLLKIGEVDLNFKLNKLNLLRAFSSRISLHNWRAISFGIVSFIGSPFFQLDYFLSVVLVIKPFTGAKACSLRRKLCRKAMQNPLNALSTFSHHKISFKFVLWMFSRKGRGLRLNLTI